MVSAVGGFTLTHDCAISSGVNTLLIVIEDAAFDGISARKFSSTSIGIVIASNPSSVVMSTPRVVAFGVGYGPGRRGRPLAFLDVAVTDLTVCDCQSPILQVPLHHAIVCHCFFPVLVICAARTISPFVVSLYSTVKLNPPPVTCSSEP
jgi:hypothetical protein